MQNRSLNNLLMKNYIGTAKRWKTISGLPSRHLYILLFVFEFSKAFSGILSKFSSFALHCKEYFWTSPLSEFSTFLQVDIVKFQSQIDFSWYQVFQRFRGQVHDSEQDYCGCVATLPSVLFSLFSLLKTVRGQNNYTFTVNHTDEHEWNLRKHKN